MTSVCEGLLILGIVIGVVCVPLVVKGIGPKWFQLAAAAGFLVALLLAGIGFVGVLASVFLIGRHQPAFPRRCSECGYERTGLDQSINRCPECGSAW